MCPTQNKLEKLQSKILATGTDSELDCSFHSDQQTGRKSIVDSVDRIANPTVTQNDKEILGKHNFKPIPNDAPRSMELNTETMSDNKEEEKKKTLSPSITKNTPTANSASKGQKEKFLVKD